MLNASKVLSNGLKARLMRMTNGDMIRSLCDGQLAKFFDRVSPCDVCSQRSLEPCDKRKCVELMKKWLKEEFSNEWIKTMIND